MSQPFHPPIIESSESLASGHTPVTAVRRRQRLPVTQNQAQPWVDSDPGGARARAAHRGDDDYPSPGAAARRDSLARAALARYRDTLP